MKHDLSTYLSNILGADTSLSDQRLSRPHSRWVNVLDSTLEKEYKLIQQKKSRLSSTERKTVVKEFEEREVFNSKHNIKSKDTL